VDAPTIRVGSDGAWVVKLQVVLIGLGATLDADGKFGPKTRAAVMAFQRANGLSVDGVVGPQTWGALRAATSDGGVDLVVQSDPTVGAAKGPVGTYPAGSSVPPGFGPLQPQGGTTFCTDLQAQLATSPQGREALAIQTQYGVKVAWMPGTANRFDADSNWVFLDSSLSKAASAGYFTHEMHHASMEHSGKSVKAQPGNKDDFVKEHVQEEIDGTVKALEGLLESERSGGVPPGTLQGLPGEAEYRSAYRRGRDLALKQTPPATPEEAHKAGLVRGKMMITAMVREGMLRPMGGVLTYSEYYAREWGKTVAKGGAGH